jgi:DNA-binding response OmpR family regulator
MHQRAHVARSRSFGAAHYVTKPFDPGDLVEKIRALIARAAA